MARNRNLKDRAAGTAKEIGGKVERGVGTLLHDEGLEVKGRANEISGHEQKEHAKARERLKGTVEEIAGSVQSRVGRALGDDAMAIKGKARQVKGAARQDANEPDDDE